MGFHYLTFMGRNLESRKKLTPVRLMNSAGLNNKNIMNSVGIFNYNSNIIINSRNDNMMNNISTNILGMKSNSCARVKFHPNFQVQLECMSNKKYSQFV